MCYSWLTSLTQAPPYPLPAPPPAHCMPPPPTPWYCTPYINTMVLYTHPRSTSPPQELCCASLADVLVAGVLHDPLTGRPRLVRVHACTASCDVQHHVIYTLHAPRLPAGVLHGASVHMQVYNMMYTLYALHVPRDGMW